jgi:hypothetical protein
MGTAMYISAASLAFGILVQVANALGLKMPKPVHWGVLIVAGLVFVGSISMAIKTAMWPPVQTNNVHPVSPFSVVSSAKLFSKTFPASPSLELPIFAYALRHGTLIAATPSSQYLGGQEINLLIYVVMTNRSESPRRITEYGLEVAQSRNGPWTALCPINFKYSRMYFVADPKKAFQWPAEEMLDSKLNEHALQRGDTVGGWTGWICPLQDQYECRPTFLRYTITDSLDVRSQYVESNAQTDTKPSHDWMAAASIKSMKADKDFSDGFFVRGNCPDGQPGEIRKFQNLLAQDQLDLNSVFQTMNATR